MNPQLMPFKTMKATIVLLQTAVLLILGTVKVEALNPEQRVLVTCIIMTRERTAELLQSNPTRKQMLIFCGAWRRWAEAAHTLIPAEQPSLTKALQDALDATAWIKTIDKPEAVPEVQP